MIPAAELDAYDMQGLITHAQAADVRARTAIDELREATFGALLALASVHNLRLPRGVDGREFAWGPAVWLTFDADGDVDAWASVLGIGPVRTKEYNDITVRAADACAAGESAVWLGWRQVHLGWQEAKPGDTPGELVPGEGDVTTEQVAAAALTPDALPDEMERV